MKRPVKVRVDNAMTRYIVMKGSMPVATASTPEEADMLYLEHDADEIREYEAADD